MRVRLRNKDVQRVGITKASSEKVKPTPTPSPGTPVYGKAESNDNNALFYTAIGLLSVDIVLQVVKIALGFL